MSKNTKNLISLGVVALILLALYLCVFLLDLKPNLGLDLSGGLSLVYEAKPPEGKTLNAGQVDKVVEIIRDRVDRLGVKEPEITKQADRFIEIQLPDVHEKERAQSLVGQTARLQFRMVEDAKPLEEAKKDPAWQVTPADQRGENKEVIIDFQGEKGGTDAMRLKLGPTLMPGTAIDSAKVGYEQAGSPKVDFQLTDAYSKKFEDITSQNKGKQLAITLDYKVESAPRINDTITGGNGEITGSFTQQEADNLAIVLNTGALPYDLKLITAEDVTATLGRDALDQSMLAGLVGIAVVGLFMLAYYRVLGVITCFGLAIFAALMYGFVCVFGEFWSLTLAGMAGIVVSIGIAADSSIVYFERLKEDLREGRTMRSSAEKAYKSAFRTILAADTVSFAAAAILYLFAVGSVKGFAFTLGMATLFDVFISYFFTRPATALMSNFGWFGHPRAVGVRPLESGSPGGERS